MLKSIYWYWCGKCCPTITNVAQLLPSLVFPKASITQTWSSSPHEVDSTAVSTPVIGDANTEVGGEVTPRYTTCGDDSSCQRNTRNCVAGTVLHSDAYDGVLSVCYAEDDLPRRRLGVHHLELWRK